MKNKKAATVKREGNARHRLEFAVRLNEALDDISVPPKGDGRQHYVGKLFNVQQSAARRWLEGMAMPRPALFQTIADKLNVRVEWLMFGLGPKRLSDPDRKDGEPQSIADFLLILETIAERENLPKAKVRKAIAAFKAEIAKLIKY